MSATLAINDRVIQGNPTKGDQMFMRWRERLPFGPSQPDESVASLAGAAHEGGKRKIPIPSNGMRDMIQQRLQPYIESGPSSVPLCAGLALLIPQVNPGSRYRCGESA